MRDYEMGENGLLIDSQQAQIEVFQKQVGPKTKKTTHV